MIRCDCGYECVGADQDQLVEDARRHAREAHGIEVPVAQILQAAGEGEAVS